MDLSTLTNTPGSRRPRKRVGRGTASGHGRQCGKGHKGQNARKGHKHKVAFEGASPSVDLKILRACSAAA
jgi:large subunit ribosomal protein L15